MKYEVLARKWRPQKFADLVGQQHVLKALINALNQQRLHHAYLFTGTRGVGKTTIARILARCLNCEQGVSAIPCGQCTACVEISAGRFIDLIEVDAASRTKVEDTRELLDNVQYAPTRGRYKVYLIDEVHMLSGHSFNALLKTLEEPPEHVKFLLATTDPQKLPITILSRCLQFNLKHLAPEAIARHLEYILHQETIIFETPALKWLAQAADGSMRDALSLLDQAINFCGGQITEDGTHEMLGTIKDSFILQILTALSEGNGKALLEISARLAETGADHRQALEALLTALHQLALIQSVPDIEVPPALAELRTTFKAEDIQLLYQIALIGKRDLPLAPTQKTGFEMILLRMLAFKPAEAVTELQQKPAAGAAPTPASDTSSAKNKGANANSAAEKKTATITNTANAEVPAENWESLIKQLKLSGMTLALASHCTMHTHTADHLHLYLDPAQAPLLNNTQQQRLQEAVSAYYNRPVSVTISMAASEIATPAKQQQQQKQAHMQAAKTTIENDEKIRLLLKSFDGQLDAHSIQPITATEE